MEEYKLLIESHRLRASSFPRLTSQSSVESNETSNGTTRISLSSSLATILSSSTEEVSSFITPPPSSNDSFHFRLLEIQANNLAISDASHILSEEQRKAVKGLVLVAKDQIAKGALKKSILSRNLAKIKNLPLEALWWYHYSEIMHINIYIALNLKNPAELGRIGSGLCEMMTDITDEGMVAAVVSDFLTALVTLVYGPEPPSSLRETLKACRIIVQSIIRRQSEAMNTDTFNVWWLQRLIGPKGTLVTPVLHRFAEELLQFQLTQPPYVSVHRALVRQNEWSYNQAPEVLITFFSLVLKAFSSPSEAAKILITVLKEGGEVNWKAVLFCVSTFLNCLPDAAAHMTILVSSLIREALKSHNNELLLLSFLLARQCSIEGSQAKCLSYPVWFQRTFGGRNTSLASTQAQCSQLLEFLIQLVPHEPAACLKAHIDQSPYVPAVCRPLLQDYNVLASTRLKDLCQGDSSNVTGLFQSELGLPFTLEEQIKYDIDKALEFFEKTGKIHMSVFEGAMFRGKYFDNNFVAELLKPRVLPATNDCRMLFIDKLLSAGKISSAQYNKYHSLCLALNK